MPKPKLRNYSTSVHAERSIGEIQGLLVQFGADKVMLENESRKTVGICFTFQVSGQSLPFKLPINIKKLRNTFMMITRRTQPGGAKREMILKKKHITFAGGC